MSEYGNGARVQIFVTLKNKQSEVVEDGKIKTIQSGHTFIAENRGGIISFIDPQTGNEDCRNYFTNVQNGSTIFARIDDLPIDENLIDLYVTNRGG